MAETGNIPQTKALIRGYGEEYRDIRNGHSRAAKTILSGEGGVNPAVLALQQVESFGNEIGGLLGKLVGEQEEVAAKIGSDAQRAPQLEVDMGQQANTDGEVVRNIRTAAGATTEAVTRSNDAVQGLLPELTALRDRFAEATEIAKGLAGQYQDAGELVQGSSSAANQTVQAVNALFMTKLFQAHPIQ
jgi:hypothetical protein